MINLKKRVPFITAVRMRRLGEIQEYEKYPRGAVAECEFQFIDCQTFAINVHPFPGD